MKISDIKAISRRMESGGWVRNLPNLPPEIALKVRAFNNSDYRRLFDQYGKELTPEEAKDPAVQEKTYVRLLHETILEEWLGIEDAPYSKERALEFLTDPEMKVFREAVEHAASIVGRHGLDSLETDAKNSPAPSVGN
ncbi:hypothetical protein FHR70_003727 [Microvirga lupini]|uniref:Uncharacterized protein n=1 Tax=Microvirga lupini TaxID=420324 RepID=A0A7W4VPG2_9HYPH|nr:hypothetical protein [Microvirga lupini]MBB3020641.1 hypothetical protein [Microvirga lupini]